MGSSGRQPNAIEAIVQYICSRIRQRYYNIYSLLFQELEAMNDVGFYMEYEVVIAVWSLRGASGTPATP